jgi:hypothetical protein
MTLAPDRIRTADEPSLVEEAGRLIGQLAEGDVVGRMLGGIAIALRCPAARPPSPLARDYSDLDIVVTRSSRRHLPAALAALEFTAADRFNAMNGHSRQLYTSRNGVDLDVFIEQFKMCHELDLKGRIEIDDTTLPLAELLLTKLQVAELTDKDVRDCLALLLDHDLADGDSGINATRICEVTSTDWGWFRTVTENLVKVTAHVRGLGLSADQADTAAARVDGLLARIDTAPKGLRWKARARVGDRVPWREEPDEKRT